MASIYTASVVPQEQKSDGAGHWSDYELGLELKTARSGKISAIRYYKAEGETGSHTGRIWSVTGQLLASVDFTSETASGWQEQALPAPVMIAANTVYVISVNCNSSYAMSQNALPIVSGDLTGVRGTYSRDPGAFPTETWNNSSYFRDVVFEPNLQPGTGGPGVLSFASSKLSVPEGYEAEITVTRKNGNQGDVSCILSRKGGTASAGNDFIADPILLSWADGDSASKKVRIRTIDDSLDERNETFNLYLTNLTGGVTVATATGALVTIVDNDPIPTVNLQSATLNQNEGNTGTTAFNFTISLNTPSGRSVTVPYTIASGTATPGVDYVASNGSVVFSPGQTTKTVTVVVTGDTIDESNETFTVSLGTPTNAIRGTVVDCVATIVNDDIAPPPPAGAIAFSSATYSLNEDGTTAQPVTLTRSSGSVGSVSATVSFSAGSASSPSDYTGTPIVVSWADGDSADKVVTIPINNDTSYEVTETFSLSLGSLTGGASLGAVRDATVQIVDNDTPPVSSSTGDEFYGPFPSWINVKTNSGAVGDGVTDDTAAIQAALNQLGQSNAVLYFPAGTYKISSTLTLSNTRNIGVIGEDPALVTLSWYGASNTPMFRTSGVSYSKIQRITFNGRNLASYGLYLSWNSQGNFPSTYSLIDNVFQNCSVGIRGGGWPSDTGGQNTASEITIERSKFLNNSSYGIWLNDWNTLNWCISYCLFDGNGIGIHSQIGGFHVYHSVFKNSAEGHIYQDMINYTGIRDCYAEGSGYFYKVPNRPGAGHIATLQNNVILDPTGTAIQIPTSGTVTLLDNTVRNAVGNNLPAVTFGGTAINVLAVGNTFSVSNPITTVPGTHRLIDIDNTTVSRASITATEPSLHTTPLRSTAPVIEVTQRTGVGIQNAINQAVANYAGQKPIVHLPFGSYNVITQISIPANSDVRLVGDAGFPPQPYSESVPGATVLSCSDMPGGYAITVNGPSTAVIQDIAIRTSSRQATGIRILNADQSGGRIFIDQPAIDGFSNSGHALRVTGLDYTVIDVANYNIAGFDGMTSVQGGTLTNAGQSTTAKVNCIGGNGGSTASGDYYSVSNGGRLLIQDQWSENSWTRNKAFNLTGSGTLTIDTMRFAFVGPGVGDNSPTHVVSGFSGKVTLIGLIYQTASLAVSGSNPLTNVLNASSLAVPEYAPVTFTNTATAGTISSLNNWSSQGGQISNSGPSDPNWIKSMLDPIRTGGLTDRTQPVPNGSTNVVIRRIGMENVANGVLVS
jgi:hypothetical protein